MPATSSPAISYAVRIERRHDRFELSIPELLLSARAGDVQQAYDELRRQFREFMDWARQAELLDRVPSPASPPVQGGSAVAIQRYEIAARRI